MYFVHIYKRHKHSIVCYNRRGDFMPYTDAQNKATQKYKAANYKRVPLDMQIADYEEMKAAAEQAGEKVNQYIKIAISQRMERERKEGEAE